MSNAAPTLSGRLFVQFRIPCDEWRAITATDDGTGQVLLPPHLNCGFRVRWRIVDVEHQDDGQLWTRASLEATIDIVDNGEDLPPREVLEQCWIHIDPRPNK